MKKNIFVIEVSTSKREQLVEITREVSDLVCSSGVSTGMCFVYVPHTTAGVTINENADPDVRKDIIKGLDSMVPRDIGYEHSEGNSPSHIKASLIGNCVQVFVENGKLELGTWQGVYFCEFDGPRARKAYIRVVEDI